MNKCPVCTKESTDTICECGYSFANNSVVDWQMFRSTIGAIPSSRWPERVRIVMNACKVTRKSEREVARCLDCSPMRVSRFVRLAYGLDKWPELMDCKSMEDAHRKLKFCQTYDTGGDEPSPCSSAFDQERDLQEFLEQKWGATSLSSNWSLDPRGHVDTGEVGIIDLLARHRTRPIWLVIELKVRRTSDDVLGQVLRYMGWIKRKHAKDGDSVVGLIIAREPDTQTLYGLECLPDVSMQCYEHKNGILELHDIDLAKYWSRQLESLSKEEILKLLDQKLKQAGV